MKFVSREDRRRVRLRGTAESGLLDLVVEASAVTVEGRVIACLRAFLRHPGSGPAAMRP